MSKEEYLIVRFVDTYESQLPHRFDLLNRLLDQMDIKHLLSKRDTIESIFIKLKSESIRINRDYKINKLINEK